MQYVYAWAESGSFNLCTVMCFEWYEVHVMLVAGLNLYMVISAFFIAHFCIGV